MSLPDALYSGEDELEASDDMPRTMPRSHVMGPGRENYATMFSARGAPPEGVDGGVSYQPCA